MKKGIVIALGLIFVTTSAFATDKETEIIERLKKRGVKIEYVYHPEWVVLYAFDGKERVTKVNNSHKWKVPHHNCVLGPVQNSSPEKFSRRATCDGKDLGAIECNAKGIKTRCEKSFGKIDVVLKIKKFPSSGD